MKTVLTSDPSAAAAFIRGGGVVAFPTETVYGLGANVFDVDAVKKIFDAKMRPSDNPLITHISDIEQIQQLVGTITPAATTLINAFFPGPLTIVLPKSEKVPMIATAGLDTIGIRMPSAGVTGAFLKAAGSPVCAPSANLSGRPSPTTWSAVYEDLNGRIDCILQGDQAEIGLESTVVDCTGNAPILLRQGAISLEDLRRIESSIRTFEDEGNLSARSPGLRHKHYAPRASVVLVDDPRQISGAGTGAYIGITAPAWAGLQPQKLCGSVADYARSLFEFFRECDRQRVEVIYCETVDPAGLGSALMDRLKRAADR